ncbi:hypothetical protein PENSUB_5373 [Penicillium subrubescens]|uniref:Copia protein n=1 Tax=Penicillium subrubescens TaxID=1316194 RepID=A0A1Q5U9Z2_9EURO|nr:hypothetical protein PENSUB_5373 [Penicillium subrubescens]
MEICLAEHLLNLPTALYQDNNGATCLTESQDFHARTKHVNVRCHHLRHQVAKGVCKFIKIPTAEQAVDGLTKPLERVKFERLVELLGMRRLSSLGIGGCLDFCVIGGYTLHGGFTPIFNLIRG